jgi:hypothetical protein
LIHSGSGNIEIFRYLRQKHFEELSAPCGLHQYHHMAIGLLFLGGGALTLNNSRNNSIAVLVASLFPVFANKQNDNQSYLQAFRHLYVLAVENRLFLTKDQSGCICSIPFRLTYKTLSGKAATIEQKTPILLPPFESIVSAECISQDYFAPVMNKEVFVQFQANKKPLDEFVCFVQKRKNHSTTYFLKPGLITFWELYYLFTELANEVTRFYQRLKEKRGVFFELYVLLLCQDGQQSALRLSLITLLQNNENILLNSTEAEVRVLISFLNHIL